MMETAIVVAVLAVIAALAVRSLIKQRKSGGGCNGDCLSCPSHTDHQAEQEGK